MDNSQQSHIVKLIKENVDKYGEVSIKSVASGLTLKEISLSEQKTLAKIVVKEHRLVSDLRRGEIFVRANTLYDKKIDWTNHDALIKWLTTFLAGILIYVIFHLIL